MIDPTNALLSFESRYESLSADVLLTDTALNIAIDVVELILADAKLIGPAVAVATKKDRSAAGQHIREFCINCKNIVQVLCDNEKA